MDKQEATDYIVSQLAKGRNRHDIIVIICEQTGAEWNLAEQFVRLVEAENRSVIVARQTPMLIGLGAFIGLGGLILALYMAVSALNGVWYALPIPGFVSLPFLGTFAAILTGLGMTAGGGVGILRASRSLMKAT